MERMISKDMDNGWKPLVSVIMSCYNCEKYIRAALESIMNQTYKNMEILVTDDGSDDNTCKIIERISNKDKRIRFIKHHKNKKLIYSLNELVNEAEGKYIARMDGDDIAEPERIAQQTEFMELHPECGVCGCQARYINKRDRIIGRSHMPRTYEETRYFMRYYSCIIHPAAMIRKDVLGTQLYSFDYLHCEDYELWVRLQFAQGVKIANLDRCLLRYRITDEQISSRNADEQCMNSGKIFDQYCVVDRKYLDRHKEIFFYRQKYAESDEEYIDDVLEELKKYDFFTAQPVFEKIVYYLFRYNRRFLYRIIWNHEVAGAIMKNRINKLVKKVRS